jgi:tape measure domain-containing protein
MSKSRVEKEIVQLMFDAKDFARGIKNSIDSLGELKKSINMDQNVKAFADLEKAADVDMTPLGKSLDTMSFKMRAMATAAGIMMADIVKSIGGAVKGLADTLILEPIATGLEEYETQINAVQTILANTAKAGTTLQDVTDALDELNEYADLTIYNFTEMTKNIGTFTAAGVDLDTSVAAIKGIANLAAVSGSSAQQAAGGMYQLSQAIASGTVKLMDWNSVQTAGIGGQIFQDALIETAKVHGIAIDSIIKKNEGFRGSLQEGWLSTEILLETLQKFTGDLSEAQLEQMGYTEEQIQGIIELGKIANDSATKIKTFTALKDNLKEILQSGWAQTWRIILGDFEQAKDLWGRVSGVFGGILEESAAARNQLLQAWANVGGRDTLVKAFFNLLEAGVNILRTFQEAIGEVFRPLRTSDLLKITNRFFHFSESVKMGSENLGWLKGIIKGVAAIFKILGLAIGAVLFPFKFLVPVIKLALRAFAAWLGIQGEAIAKFAEFAQKTGYFVTLVQQGVVHLKEFTAWVGRMVEEFLKMEEVQRIIEWFKQLRAPVIDLQKVWATLQKVLMALVAPFYLIAVGAQKLYEEFRKLGILEDIVAWFKELPWERLAQDIQEAADGIKEFYAEIQAIDWNKIGQDIKDMGQEVKDFFTELKQSELLEKFLTLLGTYDGRRFNEFMEEGQNNFQWLIDAANKFKDSLFGIDFSGFTDGISKVTETIGGALSDILDYLIENAGEIDYTQLFDVINAGLLTGILLAVKKIASGDFLSDILGEDSFFGEILEDSFDRLNGTLQSFQNNIRADTLQKVAVSIALLAGAITLMTLIDETKLGQAAGAIALMIATLFGASGALKLVKPQDAIKASIAITGLSLAVLIFATAMKQLEGMNAEEIENSMTALTLGLAGLTGAVLALTTKGGGPGSVAKITGMLLGLGTGLLIFSKAVAAFGEMDPDVLEQGLIAVAASMTGLVAAVIALDKGTKQGKLKASLAILGIANALLLLTQAVVVYGRMDPEVLQQGLLTIAFILSGLAAFSKVLQTAGLLQAAVGILIISAALYVMAGAIKLFSLFEDEALIKGLLGMAAALAIIAGAAFIMQGALPAAVAIITMSVAMLIMAAALKVLSTLSWEQLALALAAIAGVLIILGIAGYLLAPAVPVLIGLGIAMALIGVGALAMGLGLFLAAAGLVAIAGSAVGIAQAIRIVGGAIIDILPNVAVAIAEAMTGFIITIAENAETIVTSFVDIIRAMIGGVVTLIPEIVAAVYDLITAILETIAEKLPDLIQAGFDILLAFLEGIGDNIAEVVEMGLYVLTEFLAGIEDGIPALVDQAFSLILTFLEAIADAIEEYSPQIVDAGIRIGEAIVEGLVQAVTDGIPALGAAVLRLARAAWSTLVNFFQNKSPSKRTYGAGKDIVQGLINGVLIKRKETQKAFVALSKAAMDGIAPLLGVLANEVDRQLELEPVIRPVLDMEEFGRTARGASNIFGQVPTLAYNLASDINRDVGHFARPADTTDLLEGLSRREQIQYIQNNYSPKALDRAAIYRQTKTHIAKLENEALS